MRVFLGSLPACRSTADAAYVGCVVVPGLTAGTLRPDTYREAPVGGVTVLQRDAAGHIVTWSHTDPPSGQIGTPPTAPTSNAPTTPTGTSVNPEFVSDLNPGTQSQMAAQQLLPIAAVVAVGVLLAMGR